jgi:hypothetical protein
MVLVCCCVAYSCCLLNSLLLLLQRLLGEHGEIHLSALGMAVSTMVSIAEILKKDGLAVETREQQLQQLPVLSPAQQRTLAKHMWGAGRWSLYQGVADGLDHDRFFVVLQQRVCQQQQCSADHGLRHDS